MTAGPDGLEFWELGTGIKIKEFNQYKDIKKCVFSPDSLQCCIFSSSELRSGTFSTNELRIIDTEGGQETWLINSVYLCQWLHWTLDGKHVIAQDINKLDVLQANTGISHFFVDEVTTCILSPDETSIITYDWRISVKADVWELKSGENICSIAKAIYRGSFFSPDGTRFVLLDNGGELFVYNTNNWQMIVQEKIIETTPMIAWSADGQCLHVLCESNMLMIIDLDSGSEIRRTNLRAGSITSIKQAPSANLAVIRYNSSLVIYDTERYKEKLYINQSTTSSRVAWAPNSNDFLIWSSKHLQAWSLEKKERLLYSNSDKHIWGSEWSADGESLHSFEGHALQSRHLYSGDCEQIATRTLVNGVFGTVWSPDKVKVLGYALLTANINVLDVTTGIICCKIEASDTGFRLDSFSWSPDSSRLLEFCDDEIKIYSATTGAELLSLDMKPFGKTQATSWSPD